MPSIFRWLVGWLFESNKNWREGAVSATANRCGGGVYARRRMGCLDGRAGTGPRRKVVVGF